METWINTGEHGTGGNIPSYTGFQEEPQAKEEFWDSIFIRIVYINHH